MDYFNWDICESKNMLVNEEESLEWVFLTWAAANDTIVKNYTSAAPSRYWAGFDSIF